MTAGGSEKFSGTAKTLHWVTALLVLVAILFAFGIIPPGFEGMPLDERLQTLMIHSGNGIVVLLLTFYRIHYRRTHTPPAYPDTMPDWQKRASKWNVYGLYALLIYQPLVGIAHATTYVDGDIHPYGLFNLTGLVPSDAALTQVFHVMHGLGGFALSALLIVHIAAAMKHWIVDRDGVFQRMLPYGRV